MSDTATEPNAGSQSVRRLPRTIAVDGSAASGKSTIGRRLAEHLGYRFLDTGVMYRAVTHAALKREIDVEDPVALTGLADSIDIQVTLAAAGSGGPSAVKVDQEDVTDALRSQQVEDHVSLVSRVAGVREALVKKQRQIAGEQPIVMAGRDIGTVVQPDANLKLYLDASLKERARRRHGEFVDAGHGVTPEEVIRDIRRRDQIDTQRDVSPLRAAEDAVRIVTDGLSIDEVLGKVIALVEAR